MRHNVRSFCPHIASLVLDRLLNIVTLIRTVCLHFGK